MNHIKPMPNWERTTRIMLEEHREEIRRADEKLVFLKRKAETLRSIKLYLESKLEN